MVISERKEGMTKIKVKPWNGVNEHYIAFEEPVYTVYTSINPDFNTPWVRIEYTSLTTPNTTYDYNMQTKQLDLKKRMEVVGNFNPLDYTSERKMVTADDGTLVPLSIVYKKVSQKWYNASVVIWIRILWSQYGSIFQFFKVEFAG